MSESENVSSLLQDAGLGRELRAALEAGSAHDPTPGELAGLAKKLAALLPPGTLPPAPAPPPSPPAGPAAPPAAGLSGAAKIAAAAIAVLGAIGAALWLARSPAAVVVPSPAPRVAVVAETQPAPSSVESASTPEPALSASAAPVASVVAPRPSASATTTASAQPAESEVVMLQRAHHALLHGSPERALAVANESVRAYPKGMLVQEREVVAIEALVNLGRKPEARARAAAFRTAFPSSVHLARIERLTGAP